MKVLAISIILISNLSFADTFTNKNTGERFDGYVTDVKKGFDTLVRVGKSHKAKYINLTDYDIKWNYAGRREIVSTIVIDEPLELDCMAEAIVEGLRTERNQGPRFILIELDTPGGRVDLMEDICGEISKLHNCITVAYIKNGDYGGAYSAGAFIAMACDKIFMAEGTAIGAATTVYKF